MLSLVQSLFSLDKCSKNVYILSTLRNSRIQLCNLEMEDFFLRAAAREREGGSVSRRIKTLYKSMTWKV